VTDLNQVIQLRSAFDARLSRRSAIDCRARADFNIIFENQTYFQAAPWLVFFPEAEMTILPDAGHYPMFESPVSLATSIEEFLGRD